MQGGNMHCTCLEELEVSCSLAAVLPSLKVQRTTYVRQTMAPSLRRMAQTAAAADVDLARIALIAG